MTDLTDDVRALGDRVHVSSDRHARARDRLDELQRVAELGGTHMWTATAAHHVTDPAAAVAGDLLLDAESLLYVGVGCYVCERPYEKRLLNRRCPGQPRR